MKKYKNTLVAGGAGLLLGLSSIVTYGAVATNSTGVQVQQDIADKLADACAKMKDGPAVFSKYVDAVNSQIGADWKNTYCYVEGAGSSIAGTDGTKRCPNAAGTDGNALEVSGGPVETALDEIQTHLDSVLGNYCSATLCESKIFESTIAESADNSAFNQSLTGGKKDGDIALICTVGTCATMNAISGTKFIILPHSQRKMGVVDTKYAPLLTKDSAKPVSYDFGVIYKNSGGSGLSETGAEAVTAYLHSPDRCNNTTLNTLHDIRIDGTTAGSPFAGGATHWINY